MEFAFPSVNCREANSLHTSVTKQSYSTRGISLISSRNMNVSVEFMYFLYINGIHLYIRKHLCNVGNKICDIYDSDVTEVLISRGTEDCGKERKQKRNCEKGKKRKREK